MLENYLNLINKSESLFTFIIYNLNSKAIKNKIKKKMENIKKISNSFKRRQLSNRLNIFLLFIDKKYTDEKINSVFLVFDEVVEVKLSKKKIKILNEYDIHNFVYKYGNTFFIEYINDLFNDFNFVNVLNVKNNLLIHFQINSTKKKIIHKMNLTKMKELEKIDKYIQEQNLKFIIIGNSPKIKQISENNVIYKVNDIISDNEIIDVFSNYEKKEKQSILKKYIDNINNPSYDGKIIYGNFKEYILPEFEMYKLEKLFYHSTLKKNILNMDQSYINFEIHEIHSLKKNDLGDILLNNYGGFFGLKYY